MSVVIEVDADEIRENLKDKECKKLRLVLDDMVKQSDIEDNALRVAIESAAFVHMAACVSLDDDKDFRKLDVQTLIRGLVMNLIEQGKLTDKSLEKINAEFDEENKANDEQAG